MRKIKRNGQDLKRHESWGVRRADTELRHNQVPDNSSLQKGTDQRLRENQLVASQITGNT